MGRGRGFFRGRGGFRGRFNKVVQIKKKFSEKDSHKNSRRHSRSRSHSHEKYDSRERHVKKKLNVHRDKNEADYHDEKMGRSHSRDKSSPYERYSRKVHSRNSSPEHYSRKRSRSRSFSPINKRKKSDNKGTKLKKNVAQRHFNDRNQRPEEERGISEQRRYGHNSRLMENVERDSRPSSQQIDKSPYSENQRGRDYSSQEKGENYATSLYGGVTDDLYGDEVWSSNKPHHQYSPPRKSADKYDTLPGFGEVEESYRKLDDGSRLPTCESSRYSYQESQPSFFGSKLKSSIPGLHENIPGLDASIEDEEKFLYGGNESPSQQNSRTDFFKPPERRLPSPKARLNVQNSLKKPQSGYERNSRISDKDISGYINPEGPSYSSQERKSYDSNLYNRNSPKHSSNDGELRWNPLKQSSQSSQSRPQTFDYDHSSHSMKNSHFPFRNDTEIASRESVNQCISNEPLKINRSLTQTVTLNTDSLNSPMLIQKLDRERSLQLTQPTATFQPENASYPPYNAIVPTKTFNQGITINPSPYSFLPPSSDNLLNLPPLNNNDSRQFVPIKAEPQVFKNNVLPSQPMPTPLIAPPSVNQTRPAPPPPVKIKKEQSNGSLKQEVAKVKAEAQKQLQMLQNELRQLQKQQGDLHRKSRKEKDGHKNPLLLENGRLQDDMLKEVFRLTSDLNALDNGKLPPSSKKKKNLLDKNITNVYEDSGTHWCKLCNQFSNNLCDYLAHLKTKIHKQKLDPADKPWVTKIKSEATPKSKIGTKHRYIPFQGSQFLLPANGFYCCICSAFLGSEKKTTAHFKTESHNKAYDKYIAQNIFFERRWALEKQAGMASALKENERKKEEEERMNRKKKMEEALQRSKKVEEAAKKIKAKLYEEQQQQQRQLETSKKVAKDDKAKRRVVRVLDDNPVSKFGKASPQKKSESNSNSDIDPKVDSNFLLVSKKEDKKPKISMSLTKSNVTIGKFPFWKNKKQSVKNETKDTSETKQCYDRPIGPVLPPHMMVKRADEQERHETDISVSSPVVVPDHSSKIRLNLISDANAPDVSEPAPDDDSVRKPFSRSDDIKGLQLISSYGSNDPQDDEISVTNCEMVDSPPSIEMVSDNEDYLKIPCEKQVPTIADSNQEPINVGEVLLSSSSIKSDFSPKTERRDSLCLEGMVVLDDADTINNRNEAYISSIKSGNESPTLQDMFVLDDADLKSDTKLHEPVLTLESNPAVKSETTDLLSLEVSPSAVTEKSEMKCSPVLHGMVIIDDIDNKIESKNKLLLADPAPESEITNSPSFEGLFVLDDADIKNKDTQLGVSLIKSENNSSEVEGVVILDDADSKVEAKNQKLSPDSLTKLVMKESSLEGVEGLVDVDSKVDIESQDLPLHSVTKSETTNTLSLKGMIVLDDTDMNSHHNISSPVKPKNYSPGGVEEMVIFDDADSKDYTRSQESADCFTKPEISDSPSVEDMVVLDDTDENNHHVIASPFKSENNSPEVQEMVGLNDAYLKVDTKNQVLSADCLTKPEISDCLSVEGMVVLDDADANNRVVVSPIKSENDSLDIEEMIDLDNADSKGDIKKQDLSVDCVIKAEMSDSLSDEGMVILDDAYAKNRVSVSPIKSEIDSLDIEEMVDLDNADSKVIKNQNLSADCDIKPEMKDSPSIEGMVVLDDVDENNKVTVSPIKSESDSPVVDGMVVLDEIDSEINAKTQLFPADYSKKSEINDSLSFEGMVILDDADKKDGYNQVAVSPVISENYTHDDTEGMVVLDDTDTDFPLSSFTKSEIIDSPSFEGMVILDDKDSQVSTSPPAKSSNNSPEMEGMFVLDDADSKVNTTNQDLPLESGSPTKYETNNLPSFEGMVVLDDADEKNKDREETISSVKFENESPEGERKVILDDEDSNIDYLNKMCPSGSMLKTEFRSSLSIEGMVVADDVECKNIDAEMTVIDEMKLESKEDSEEIADSKESLFDQLPQIELENTKCAVTDIQGSMVVLDVAAEEDGILDEKLLQAVHNQLDSLADSTEDGSDLIGEDMGSDMEVLDELNESEQNGSH